MRDHWAVVAAQFRTLFLAIGDFFFLYFFIDQIVLFKMANKTLWKIVAFYVLTHIQHRPVLLCFGSFMRLSFTKLGQLMCN